MLKVVGEKEIKYEFKDLKGKTCKTEFEWKARVL